MSSTAFRNRSQVIRISNKKRYLIAFDGQLIRVKKNDRHEHIPSAAHTKAAAVTLRYGSPCSAFYRTTAGGGDIVRIPHQRMDFERHP
jgi:hypothetical protein